MQFLTGKNKGFTLVEAAVIILLLSLALIPVIKMVSNSDSTAAGDFTGSSGGQLLAKEVAVANTLMEKAVAGDQSIVLPVIASPDVGAATDSAGSAPAGSILAFQQTDATPTFEFGYLDSDGNYVAPYTPPTPAGEAAPGPASGLTEQRYEYPRYYYSDNVYYQWIVEDAVLQEYDPVGDPNVYKSFMPKGNSLTRATLRVYVGADAATKANATYSVATYFFKNTADNLNTNDDFDKNIGVVLVVDLSLSMKLANKYGTNGDEFYERAPAVDPQITGKVPFANVLAPLNLTGGVALPLRMSSGLNGYDPAAIASPYLVYRTGVNDLFFSREEDDGGTPYDERYNPCVDSATDGTFQLGSYPAGKLLNNASILTAINTTCGAPTPQIPVTATAADIHLPVPSLPYSTIASNLDTNNGYGYTLPGNINDIYGPTNCFNRNTMDSAASTCKIFQTDGFEYFPGTEKVLPDIQLTEWLTANLFAAPGNPGITQATLSRIEAARTAMLAFVETVETDADLADNFRIGIVPFATEVQDGVNRASVPAPVPVNEVIPIRGPTGNTFPAIKQNLTRINRACDFTGHVYAAVNAPNCPGNTITGGAGAPITLTGDTNLAHALYYAQQLMHDYDDANPSDKLDSRIVILLTDGAPTKSSTGIASIMAGTHFFGGGEPAWLQGIATDMKNDAYGKIDIYSVGLLTAGDPDAVAALGAINGASPDNALVYVDSVADLTPVFESIAQQAERLLLMSMKDRYEYLNY